MEVIAKTKDGLMISATEGEVCQILKSVTGNDWNKIEIGQKIPAIDYSSSIIKLKTIKESYGFKNLGERIDEITDSYTRLSNAVEMVSKIDV